MGDKGKGILTRGLKINYFEDYHPGCFLSKKQKKKVYCKLLFNCLAMFSWLSVSINFWKQNRLNNISLEM